MVIRILPKAEINRRGNGIDSKSIYKIAPYVSVMFLIMVIFYTMPSNFSMIMTAENLLPPSFIGLLRAVQNVTAFITGLALSIIVKKVGKYTKYFTAGMLTLGFLSLSFTGYIVMVILGLIALGIGLGILVPIMNAQISLHVDKEQMTSAMSIMSAMLYLGQFLSPIFIDGIQSLLHLQGIQIPFYLAMILSLALLISLIWIPVHTGDQ